MVIALLTDFGDFYPGVMKGVIRKITREEVIDITHSVRAQNVFEGAFLLYNSYRFFPEGTIFVSVVDPGVGGRRRAVAIQTRNYWFVSPDNGIAYPSASEDGIRRVLSLDVKRISKFSGGLSSTFPGRDVFAPAAALIAEGKIDEYGDEIDDIVKLELFKVETKGEKIRCRVAYIDRFGNVVTNVRREVVEEIKPKGFYLNGTKLPLVEKYEDVNVGEPLALIGSFNTLEISIREGNAAETFEISDELEIRWFK